MWFGSGSEKRVEGSEANREPWAARAGTAEDAGDVVDASPRSPRHLLIVGRRLLPSTRFGARLRPLNPFLEKLRLAGEAIELLQGPAGRDEVERISALGESGSVRTRTSAAILTQVLPATRAYSHARSSLSGTMTTRAPLKNGAWSRRQLFAPPVVVAVMPMLNEGERAFLALCQVHGFAAFDRGP